MFLEVIYIYYNSNPDSLVSKIFIARILPNSEGIFSFFDNRHTVEFNEKYSDFIHEGGFRWITGWGNPLDEDFPNGGNASYRNFIYDYGVLGFLLLWAMYGVFLMGVKSVLPIGLFILYVVSFLQRPYGIWLSQIFIFISFCFKYKRVK